MIVNDDWQWLSRVQNLGEARERRGAESIGNKKANAWRPERAVREFIISLPARPLLLTPLKNAGLCGQTVSYKYKSLHARGI
jgi:hypothetical protein